MYEKPYSKCLYDILNIYFKYTSITSEHFNSSHYKMTGNFNILI